MSGGCAVKQFYCTLSLLLVEVVPLEEREKCVDCEEDCGDEKEGNIGDGVE